MKITGKPVTESESCSVVSDSLQPHGLYSPWNFSGQNTGVGSLLQGIFPTQGSNPGLSHCRHIFYQLSHQGSPRRLEWVAYPVSSVSSQPALQADSLPLSYQGSPVTTPLNYFFWHAVVVVQSLCHVRFFVTPWAAAYQASLFVTISQSLLKFMSIESVMLSNHLILCHLLLLLPSVFPSIRIFSSELALCFRCLNYWSFSISLSNDYLGFISFRIDWFDLLAVAGLKHKVFIF